MKNTKLNPFYLTAGLLFCLVASLGPGCADEPAPGAPTPAADTRPAVARMAINSGDLQVREPGQQAFEPLTPARNLVRGATLRSGPGISSLVFLGSVQVQLSPHTELVLEGKVKNGPLVEYVLGLQKGEVRVNASPGPLLVLRMPHCQVSGIGACFNAALDLDPDNGFLAEVKAFSLNLQISNAGGSLVLPAWAVVRVDEDNPPQVTQELKKGR